MPTWKGRTFRKLRRSLRSNKHWVALVDLGHVMHEARHGIMQCDLKDPRSAPSRPSGISPQASYRAEIAPLSLVV